MVSPRRQAANFPAEELQGDEAASVTQLKNAGALIMGKTVTTEFAYFTPGPRATRIIPNTLQAVRAVVRRRRSARACATSPSAHRPSARDSSRRVLRHVVGLKPTYERISRDGVIPLSPTFDHVGFFAPDVDTAKRVASVLIRDWRLETKERKPTLGIPEGPYLACASDYALACFNDLCLSLTDAGYDLRRVRIMDDFQDIRDRHDAIMSFDAAQVHKEWFAKYESLYSSKFSDLSAADNQSQISNL
jgi:Asp-tRNA(Asn)/Glu-tRNA(Gln) amidotransferase A subunit family amidase